MRKIIFLRQGIGFFMLVMGTVFIAACAGKKVAKTVEDSKSVVAEKIDEGKKEVSKVLGSGPDVDWAFYGNDHGNTRYSSLDQINDKNVKNLALVWTKEDMVKDGYECTPIVVNGVMYVTTPQGPDRVYALDPVTGKELWNTKLDIPQDYAQYACCGIVNRGASYSDGMLYVGRLDGKLTALDAKTGKEVWTVTVIDYKSGAVITSAPLIINDKVITGHGGGEYGTNSRIVAYNKNTGEEIWRFYTVPQDDENVKKTWKGESYKTPGASTWVVGSYDKEENTIYWGTSNPTPWNSKLRGDDPDKDGNIKHTNLYSCSVIALDPETGKMKWYFQKTPFDSWDYDGVNENVFATLDINGVKTKVIMIADRNGFLYVINRKTGELISADKYARKVNWATGYNMETKTPIEDPRFRVVAGVDKLPEAVFPSWVGAKNWEPTSYNPNTGLLYIPSNNMGMTWEVSEAEYNRGSFYLGAGWGAVNEPGHPLGEYVAWDPVKREKKWGIGLPHPIPGGSITTKGNLLFFGDLTGRFFAYNATTGEKLWEYKTKSGIVAGPSTYKINGVQYIAVMEGRPDGVAGLIGSEIAKNIIKASEKGGKLNVFALKK